MADLVFDCMKHPSNELCDVLESIDSFNPYCTLAYRDAIVGSGRLAWLLGVWSDGNLLYGCLAEYSQGRLSRGLHIQSAPTQSEGVFWDGLMQLCRVARLTHLSIGTIGTAPDIPLVGFVLQKKYREEYWIDLTVGDPKSLLRGEQRRIFNRATDAGMFVQRVTGPDAVARHRELTSHSLGRRRNRGEIIPQFEENDVPFSLLESGAAHMYEAVLGDSVVGSVIITLAISGAHGYSAGFSKEGLKAGAGVFLNLTTFNLLKELGVVRFNLGDAPSGTGLALFKKGLGGVIHSSTAVQFHVGGALHRHLLTFKSKVERLIRH